MNEKINFLKFFMEHNKDADTASLTEKIPDFFPALVFIYDVENKKLSYTNNRSVEYFRSIANGVQYEECDFILNFVYHEDVPAAQHELQKIWSLEDNKTINFTCRFNHQQEVFHYFKVSGSVLYKTLDGKPGAILFIAQDINDEVKKNEEAEARELLYKETEELLQYGSWNWHIKTNCVTWTDGLCRILGYQQGEISHAISNEFFMDHVLPEYHSLLQNAIRECLENKTNFDVEYSIKTRSGEQKILFTKGKVIVNNHGEIEKILGITRDMTTWRNFERDQERSLKELNRSNKELEEFAYVASHDLQEPLRKISMFSERLRSKCSPAFDKDAQLFMDRIQMSAGNMKTLIDNLLEFSRTNRSSQAFERVDLQHILHKVIANFELKIEETRAEIKFLSPLPVIDAVPSEMEQLFNNLVSNAIKFRNEEIAPKITIATHVASNAEKATYHLPVGKNYFVVVFKDNGIGFEEEYADKIFQIFHRLHGKTEYPGSGIGLAICKKIIDNHNGIIYARSALQEGASFTILIPEKQY